MNNKLTFQEIVAEAVQREIPLWGIILESEVKNQAADKEELWQKMRQNWLVMCQSAKDGLKAGNMSFSGLVGEEGEKLFSYWQNGKNLSGNGTTLTAARAMAISVINATMGKIVAAPTAGSCGILPAVLLTVAEKTCADENQIIGALFTAAGVGMVIDENASTSGAKGGCQAECGTASCMAAVAAVEMAGGTPDQAANAGAIALKSVLGLVCDPVAGLVEVPCVKRNAMGAANALLAADMALSGIESKIPLDEVITAMQEISDKMSPSLRETALGGLANTPTGIKIKNKILGSSS